MPGFRDYLLEEKLDLTEALITFAGQAYPKFGNVVILAGGAGSGKGFVKDKLMGIEGFSFDVDQLKLLAVRTPAIIKKVKSEMGFDISALDPKKDPDVLKNPDNVFTLHTIIGDTLGLDNKRKAALFTSVLTAPADRKPNLIFDITMKSMSALEKYAVPVQDLGYDKKNIHIIWVVNDIEVARSQNKQRDRIVPDEILVNTHRGASSTMHDIINMGKGLERYMDGDIVLAFNKFKVDAELKFSDQGGAFIDKANYVYIKHSGKPVDINTLTKELRAKIGSYVPPSVSWEN